MIAIYQYLLIGADIFSSLEADNIEVADEFLISIIENVHNHEKEYIETINEHLTDWRFDRLGVVEQAIMLLALGELNSGLNEKAVVINEAVELAKIYCEEDSYRLINATLDCL